MTTTHDTPSGLGVDEILTRLDRLSLEVAAVSEELRQAREERAALLRLTELGGPAMQMATDRLQELDDRGYFAFARGGWQIVDRVVSTYSEDDVKALGDNIILILDTVKEMTQPEVMGLLSRTAVEVQELEDAPAGPPPSTFALLRQMRDPEVRRGLSRALTVLRSLGAQGPAAGRGTPTDSPTITDKE